MNKTVAISQSNYIPWRGYFDLIAKADVFILYDEMQYTRRDWRNRNKLKTKDGLKWLTVPVKTKGNYHEKISSIQIQDTDWSLKHFQTLKTSYQTTPFYSEIEDLIAPIYLGQKFTHLSNLNETLIRLICNYLGINTPVYQSNDFDLVGNPSEKLMNICKQLDATCYLSGPNAKAYLDSQMFAQNNIEVCWMDYSNYPEYTQKYGNFVGEVTILDLLFNAGSESFHFMKYARKD